MTDQAELSEIEQRLIKAWLERDRADIDALLDDDWSVIDPSGRLLSKTQVLAEFDTGERQLESGTIDEIRVRVFGETAVVTGRTTASGNYQGESVSVKLRFTDVFVRQDGRRWRVVASQATLISE